MIVTSQLQVFHSPVGTPTRRVAPGACLGEPSGIVLLGQVLVAEYCSQASDDEIAAVGRILDSGLHIPTTQLRFRLQWDTEGLDWSRHWITYGRHGPRAVVDTHGPGAAQVLAAIWAVNDRVGPDALARLAPYTLRQAPILVTRYSGSRNTPAIGSDSGEIDPGRVGRDDVAWPEPVGWALEQLGLEHPGDTAGVRQAFRLRARAAHPDSGTDTHRAAEVLHDLGAARAILLDWIASVGGDGACR